MSPLTSVLPVIIVLAGAVMSAHSAQAQGSNYVPIVNPTLTLQVYNASTGSTVTTNPTFPGGGQLINVPLQSGGWAKLTLTGGSFRWIGNGTPTDLQIMEDTGVGGSGSLSGTVLLTDSRGDALPPGSSYYTPEGAYNFISGSIIGWLDAVEAGYTVLNKQTFWEAGQFNAQASGQVSFLFAFH